ncbi:XrtA/PEP-CTERM system TPR-repeat protein PrsT [Rheinheimera maricola]|uniref:PEP-CTERM system TPR-repeat protein PrsT n=1 Tax=Rheinheimera maricola TaxID=2793282 RepID=A0ABS7X886_9GAMM|nr:XrtA/PEP-CTERM system TPR-repeat protein PrsT [Rheinheimera maricola]MBZ9611754.1 PEP-CTERM system TPR-repeat protein PrsT [Rheinheimera maricola]
MIKKTTLLAGAVMLALLAGCSGKDATEHYTDGLSFIADKKYNAAVIELKSAVQQAPDNADYRLALGLLHLQIGDNVSAEKELTRAMELGADQQKVVLPLFRASYQAGSYPAVLQLLADATLPDNVAVYADTYRALAQLELGDADAAIALFDKLATQQQFTDVASYAQAHLLVANRNNAGAVETAKQVAEDSPLYAEALYLQGRSLLAEENYQASIDALRSYLQLVPNNLQARLMLTQSLVQTTQLEEADKQLALLLKAFPNQPLVNYLKAMLEYERKGYVKAKEHAEAAINNGMRNSSVRIIAALSSLNQQLNSQALHHLDAIKTELHKYAPLQNLYAQLQLQSGQTVQAKDILLNQDAQTLDTQLLAATTFQLLKTGDNKAAQELIAKYEQRTEKDSKSLTQLGMLRMNIAGQQALALRDLEQALQLDPGQNQTRVLLAISYLRQNMFAEASKTVDEWLDNEELAVLGYNIKAYAAILQQQLPEADALLQQAQQAATDHPFTLLLQANLAAARDDMATAQQLLIKSMELYPGYIPALQQYFGMNVANDNGADAIKRANSMLEKAPDDKSLRLTLGRMYYHTQAYQQAIDVLSEPSLRTETAPAAFWVTLLDAHAKLRNHKEVLSLSEQWYKWAPDNFNAAYFYANSLGLAQRFNEALPILDKQLQLNPTNLMLLRSKILQLAETKDYAKALETLRQVKPDDAATAEMQFIKGRVLFLNGQIPPAMEAFTASYDLAPSDQTAMFIAEVYSKDYSHQRAVQFLEQHFAKSPASGNLKLFYANLLLQSDKAKSFRLYDEILTESPDNYIVLNNYAWELAAADQLEQAQQYIEKALQQAPKHPDVLDTYGKVLMKQNKLAEAVKVFEQSLAIRPENNLVQLNYAEALARSGSKDKARSIIARVKNLNSEQNQKLAEINALLN